MRVAFFPDDYLPDSTLVHAKMIHELALEFQRLGHETIVITPGSPEQNDKLVIDFIDNVEVWRFRSGKTRGVGKVQRAINESLLSLRAWVAVRKQVKKRPFDLVVNYSPTIFFGGLVYLIKRVNPDCKSYLVLRDLFPQWVIDEGMIRENSLIAYYFKIFERFNYQMSDMIGLMSEANLKYFKQLHSDINHLEILRNWSQIKAVKSDPNIISVRESLDLGDKIILFYGGNIGHAQDMTNVMRLARNLLSISEAHLLLVGQGDEFELVKRLKQEWRLTNVTILPSVDQETYKQYLKQVDIGLFSLSKTHKAHNFPGKIMGYMLEKLPVLGSVNPGNDLVEFINNKGAGYACINGCDDELYEAAVKLIKSCSLRMTQGHMGFQVLNDYFSVQNAAEQISLLLTPPVSRK